MRARGLRGIVGDALVSPGLKQATPVSAEKRSQAEAQIPGLHDFDFLVGHWRVHHRKLKERLANNHEWIDFEGTLTRSTPSRDSGRSGGSTAGRQRRPSIRR
jgi:hypothetical protein